MEPTKVVNFIDEVNQQMRLKNEIQDAQNSPAAKERRLNQTKDDAVNTCMNSILSKVCNSSLPDINGRTPDVTDLDKIVADYISRRTGGENADFYVKEAIKKNKKCCAMKAVRESVCKMISEMYMDKTVHPEKLEEKDFGFEITPEVDEKLDQIIKDNNLDDLSEVIKDNVREDAVSEVEAAKKEKEDRKQLEEELAQNPDITTEAALNTELKRRQINENVLYTPSLFNAVMIHAFENAKGTEIPFSESVDMEMYTEGIINKIKDRKLEKNDQKTEKIIEEGDLALYGVAKETYTQLYSEYRASVASIDLKKLKTEFLAAIKDMGNLTIKIPDLENYSKDSEKFTTSVKENIKLGVRPKGKLPKPKYVPIPAKDAFTKAISIVNKLEKSFATPDMEGFIKKYTAGAANIARKMNDPKKASAVYSGMNTLIMAAGRNIMTDISFVASVIKYGQKLTSHANNTEMKEAAFDRGIIEYTLLNMSKALYLESFDRTELPVIINSYLK